MSHLMGRQVLVGRAICAAVVKKHHTTVLVKLIAVFTPTGGLPRSASFGGIRITG